MILSPLELKTLLTLKNDPAVMPLPKKSNPCTVLAARSWAPPTLFLTTTHKLSPKEAGHLVGLYHNLYIVYTFFLSYIFYILAKHFCSCDERRDGTAFVLLSSNGMQHRSTHSTHSQCDHTKKNVGNGDALSFNCTEILLHVLL